MTRVRAVVLLLILSASFFVAAAGPAHAHPLGNFSINRFSGIEVTRDAVSIHYVVDMAEVPTFQARLDLDADGDEQITGGELESFAARTARKLVANLSLRADDADVAIAVDSASARLGRGQGGLEVLRMEFEFTGELPAPEVRLHFRDANYDNNLGWREVVAYGTGGRGIAAADVPAESVSKELRTYPDDLLTSPLDVTEATVDVAPGAERAGPGVGRPQADPAGVFAGAFSSLVERELSPAFTGFAVLVALLSGALHALGPGHGKTVMAAYLVGTAGRARHAIAVGVAISLMHTASVIGLCLVTLWAQNVFAPESVYPWLSLISGVVVLCLGTYLLWTRWRRGSRGHGHTHSHDHGHGEHSHAHEEHSHSHGPAATGAPERSPVSWRGLGALALSGGLLPSPAALVVLLGAIALHRIAFGFLLVLSFSVGLAGALTLIGVLVLRAKEFTARRFGRSAAALPLLSAAAILAMGLFLTTRAAFGL
jgi:ABC-type nickel/cobalt efflux system permease component RcnA